MARGMSSSSIDIGSTSADAMTQTADPLTPSLDPARVGRAVTLAAQAHAGQLRKGTRIPYLAHVLGVASIALEHGADEEQCIAALLHDYNEEIPHNALDWLTPVEYRQFHNPKTSSYAWT